MSSVPPPLPYATPEPARPPRAIFDLSVGVTCVMFAAVVTIACFTVMPRFERVFMDFKTRLPPGTQAALGFSRWLTVGGGWVVVWTICLGLPFLTPLLGRVGRRVARVLITLVALALVGGMAYAIVSPYVGLIEAVSGGSGKR